MSGSEYEQQAAIFTAPHIDKIAVISVGTSSAFTNLADAAQLGPECEQGRFVTLIADALIYYQLNNTGAGTADETAVSGSNRVFALPAGMPMSFILRKGFTWLVHKAPAATKVRAYVSSLPAQELTR
jgi:hypothetical protein